jgi:hypothetical protein
MSQQDAWVRNGERAARNNYSAPRYDLPKPLYKAPPVYKAPPPPSYQERQVTQATFNQYRNGRK